MDIKGLIKQFISKKKEEDIKTSQPNFFFDNKGIFQRGKLTFGKNIDQGIKQVFDTGRALYEAPKNIEKGLQKAAMDFIVRPVARAGFEIPQTIHKAFDPTVPNEITLPQGSFRRKLLGDEPLKPLQYQPKERLARQLTSFLPENYQYPTAVALSTLGTSLDVLPFGNPIKGGAKKVAKEALEAGAKGGIKQVINNPKQFAQAVYSIYNGKVGGSVKDSMAEIFKKLQSTYKISDKVLDAIDSKPVVGKGFSIERVGKNLEVIFDEGFRPLKETASKAVKSLTTKAKNIGVRLPSLETPKNFTPLNYTPINLEKMTAPQKLLPGVVSSLSPKQSVDLYKRTGIAYPFVNVLKKTGEKAIPMLDDASDLATTVSRKSEVFNVEDIAKDAKDIRISSFFNHPRRLLSNLGEKVKNFTVDHHAKSLADASNFIEDKIKLVKETLNRTGIKQGSKESKLLFKVADGQIKPEELATMTDKAPQIIEANRIIRQFYDDILDAINAERVKHGLKEIERMDNYITHLVDIADRSKKAMEGDVFSRQVVGDVPFFGFGKKRIGSNKFKEDPFEALDAYARASAYQISMPSVINRYKILSEALGMTKLTNYKKYVDDLTYYLQKGIGQEDTAIREGVIGLQDVTGAINALSSRISKNLVRMNFSASLSNLTQALTTMPAEIGWDATLAGIRKTLLDPKNYDDMTSIFLRNRKDIEKLSKGNIANRIMDKIDVFSHMTRLADRIAYNSFLEYAIKLGMKGDEAIRFASDKASLLMGERAFGLTPKAHRLEFIRPLTMFTLEPVNALYSFFKDIPAFSKNPMDLAVRVGLAMVYANVFNQVMERSIGRRFAFDPVDIAIRTIDVWMNKPYDTGEKTSETGRIISRNIPLLDVAFGKGAGGLPIGAPLPTTQELKEDPTMAFTKAVLVGANPVGGGYQAYKTIEGLRAFNQGSVNTPAGDIKYPVERNLENFLRLIAFGKASVQNAREYYDEKRKPLSARQSAEFREVRENLSEEEAKKLYDGLMFKRAVESEVMKLKTDISNEVYRGTPPEEIRKMAEDKKKELSKNLEYYISQYNQPRGVYSRVFDMLASLVGIHTNKELESIVGQKKGDTELLPTNSSFTPRDLSTIFSDIIAGKGVSFPIKTGRGVSIKGGVKAPRIQAISLKIPPSKRPTPYNPTLKITPLQPKSLRGVYMGLTGGRR